MIEVAIIDGSRHDIACNDVGIDIKTFKRWKINIEDKRRGPLTVPANKLAVVEIQEIVKVSTSAEYVALQALGDDHHAGAVVIEAF